MLETLEAAETRTGFSLDRRVGDDDGDLPIGELLAAPEPYEEREDLLALADLIAGLPECPAGGALNSPPARRQITSNG